MSREVQWSTADMENQSQLDLPGSEEEVEEEPHSTTEVAASPAQSEPRPAGGEPPPPPLPTPGSSPQAGSAAGGGGGGGWGRAPGLEEKVDASWQVSTVPERKTYFAMDANLIDAAINAVKARLDERDANIRSAWLLSEIDHWDLEKERLILLSDNNLISVKYNFIQSSVEELKYIPLVFVKGLLFGDFKYSSYVFSRRGKGLKITWGSEERVRFMDRWNPFTAQIPFTMLSSHVLARRRAVHEPRLSVETLVPELERAVQEAKRAQSSEGDSAAEFKVDEGDIVQSSLLGFTALVHNSSNMGYFKRRGAMDWYKNQVPDEAQRRLEGIKVKRKFTAKIPLVVGRVSRSDLPELERCKFLFPASARVGDLCQYINNKMGRPDHAPLFIYADAEIIVSKESTMAALYQEHRENDYFLYLAYFEENIYNSDRSFHS